MVRRERRTEVNPGLEELALGTVNVWSLAAGYDLDRFRHHNAVAYRLCGEQAGLYGFVVVLRFAGDIEIHRRYTEHAEHSVRGRDHVAVESWILRDVLGHHLVVCRDRASRSNHQKDRDNGV